MMFQDRGLSPYEDPREELDCDVCMTVKVWVSSSGKDEEEAKTKAWDLLHKVLSKGDPKADIIQDYDIQEMEVEG